MQWPSAGAAGALVLPLLVSDIPAPTSVRGYPCADICAWPVRAVTPRRALRCLMESIRCEGVSHCFGSHVFIRMNSRSAGVAGGRRRYPGGLRESSAPTETASTSLGPIPCNVGSYEQVSCQPSQKSVHPCHCLREGITPPHPSPFARGAQ